MNVQGIISLLREKPEAASEADERIYELAAAEVAAKRMRPGLYAKAFAEVQGDLPRAVALYISYRVEQIKKEVMEAIGEAPRHTQEPEPQLLNACPACGRPYSQTMKSCVFCGYPHRKP
jgi:hypothetical protein